MNRYRLFCFVLLLTTPLLTQAQSNRPIGGHFGIKVGAGITNLNVSGITANVPKQAIQPHIGVMYRYRYNRFVLQPEALIAVKGSTFQVERLGNKTTTKVPYTYLSVPILLGYIPTEGLTIQAGPEFSYALSTGENGPGQRNDLGIAVGVHYDFLDMFDKLSLHLRYVYGLNNVSPEPLATYKNRTFQASIVYNLYKKPKK